MTDTTMIDSKMRLQQWAQTSKRVSKREARKFADWYQRTFEFWIAELKLYGDQFFLDSARSVKLAYFEGQSFENLWNLYKTGYSGR